MLEPIKVKITKLQDPELNKINDKVQGGESITTEDLNKLWVSFAKIEQGV